MAVEIFFSYARKDSDMVEELKKQLRPLELVGDISVWYDPDIRAGSDWEKEIDKHLNMAHIILLFVSPNFVNSDYCIKIEMKQAMSRYQRGEAHVIPIILHPVRWQELPIGRLQALPNKAKPISLWRPREKGYNDAADSIYEVVQNVYIPQQREERKKVLLTFSQLIEAVKSNIEPEARATAVAGTLQQISVFIPNSVAFADIVIGWRVLSQTRPGDEVPVTRRRTTCAELAEIGSQFTKEQGNLTGAVKTWQAWLDAFKDSDDPRHVVMAKTFARELAELQEAAH